MIHRLLLSIVICLIVTACIEAEGITSQGDFEYIKNNVKEVADINNTLELTIRIHRTGKTNSQMWQALVNQIVECGKADDEAEFFHEGAVFMKMVAFLKKYDLQSNIKIMNSQA